MPLADLEEFELYYLIRRAVRDAIWDVIGTIMLLFLSLVIFLTGLSVLTTVNHGTGPGRILVGMFGFVLVVLAVLLVLREFQLWPFGQN